MSKRQITFIVNPQSANGATGKQWPEVRADAERILGPFETFMTAAPGDATLMSRRARLSGTDLVVCVGGDGTLNEVVNGLMDSDQTERPAVVLGMVPSGTGCDFFRSTGGEKKLEAVLASLAAGKSRPMDLGKLTYRNADGDDLCRFFLNVASFGLGGEVVERVNRTTKLFGGFLSFIWATLVTILIYKKKHIRLQVDDGFSEEIVSWHVAVANGQYQGGSMWVAPGAEYDDGCFQVTLIGDLSLMEIFRHLPKLYNGKIYQPEKITKLTGRHIIASSEQEVLLDLDGEQPGKLPVDIELIPAALNIISY